MVGPFTEELIFFPTNIHSPQRLFFGDRSQNGARKFYFYPRNINL